MTISINSLVSSDHNCLYKTDVKRISVEETYYIGSRYGKDLMIWEKSCYFIYSFGKPTER